MKVEISYLATTKFGLKSKKFDIVEELCLLLDFKELNQLFGKYSLEGQLFKRFIFLLLIKLIIKIGRVIRNDHFSKDN